MANAILTGQSGKKLVKTVRFVVGTSTSVWTEKDCDYLCDGTADDVEINAAITALPAAGGEIVILDGTYNITAKIDVTKNNVSIRGNGNATILKRMFNSTSAEGVITLTGVSGCKIADLQVDGNRSSYDNNNNYGIYLEFASNNTITSNTYTNNNYGIYLNYASNKNTIMGNTCNDNFNYGIYLKGSSNNNAIMGNTCNNNVYGISLNDSSNNNAITGNTCNDSGWGMGISVSSTNDNVIIGNTCNNNYRGIIFDSSNNNTITSNNCNNNDDGTGIYLYSSNDNTITGNSCNNNSESISLSSSNKNTIAGNNCNNNVYGIYLNYASNNNAVTGNTCNNNVYGISLNDSSNNNAITGNTCIRGTGLETDYTERQHTIRLGGADNSYNLISNNNCMGKAVTVDGGTGNTLVNNKFDDSDDIQALATARFVIGTSTAGWTSADCNYLCDGTADDVEINAAITALPATGGEIVILDGTYNITAKIDVTKDNVSIKGNGNATILKRMFNSSIREGAITLNSRSGCEIVNLQVDGNKASYTNNNNSGIYLESSGRNTVTGNNCNNNNCGIILNSGNENTITGNTCYYNNNSGIHLDSLSNNTITGNSCNYNNNYGINLEYSSNNNTITGNTCNNNGNGINLFYESNSNTITGNTCIRGTGLPTDYTASQHTIRLNGTGNNYNLISNNNCMGKAVTVDGGTGNTIIDNKWSNSSGRILESYSEKLVALSGTSTAINLSLGNVFTHSLTGNTTYTITNAVSGQAHSFTLMITQTATVRTLTFPASVKWQDGEIPDLATASKTYILTFMTIDGGTTWLGMFGGEF